MRCPWCGNKNTPELTTCAFCGKDLLAEQSTEDAIEHLETLDVPSPEIVCPQCGAHHSALAQYCTLCGATFVARPEPPRPEQLVRRLAKPDRDTPAGDHGDDDVDEELERRFEGMVRGLRDEADPAGQFRIIAALIVAVPLFCCVAQLMIQTLLGSLSASRAISPRVESPPPVYFTPNESVPATKSYVMLPMPPGARVVSSQESGPGTGSVVYSMDRSPTEVAAAIQASPAMLTLKQNGWTVAQTTTASQGSVLKLSRSDDSGAVETISIVVVPGEIPDGSAKSIIEIEYYVPGADVVGPGV